MSSLQTSLLKTLSADGWLVRSDSSGISAERDGALEKWLFGKRSVKLYLELKLDEANKILRYAETAVEEKKGVPPPGHRVDPQTGMAEHNEARRAIEKQCKKFKWVFEERVVVPEPAREK